MPPPVSRTLGRWETQLDLLRDHSALGPPVRFYFRRREQLLYLVVGGWNTVFGYGVWALMQYVLGNYLHYLAIVVLSWPVAVLNACIDCRLIVFRSRGPCSGSNRGGQQGDVDGSNAYDPPADLRNGPVSDCRKELQCRY